MGILAHVPGKHTTVFRNFLEQPGAFIRRTFQAWVFDMDQSVAARIAMMPFKAVEQGGMEPGAHIQTALIGVHHANQRLNMFN